MHNNTFFRVFLVLFHVIFRIKNLSVSILSRHFYLYTFYCFCFLCFDITLKILLYIVYIVIYIKFPIVIKMRVLPKKMKISI